MNNQEVLNLAKQILTFASAYLVARGVLTKDQAQSVITDVFVIVPAVTGAASIIWSVYSHWNMKKVPETATVISK